MLTEFALDNSFFESDTLTSKGNNRSFIEKWKEYGVLILSEDQSEEFFLEKLKEKILNNKIPANVYQDWQNAFLDNSIFLSNNKWGSYCDYSDYTDIYSLNENFKTGITEETSFNLIKILPNYIAYCPIKEFEVIEIDEHHLSKNILRSYYESKSDINRNSEIEKVWLDKFHTLAKFSKNIVIIDRYFFENMRDDIGKKRKTSIECFFNFLMRYSKKYNITVISIGGEDKSDEQFPIDSFFSDLCESKYAEIINKIELISKAENFFQKISHDRFISFDKFVCTIGVGFTIFQDYPVPQTSFNIVREEYSSINERIKLARKSCEWKIEYLPKQKKAP
ncbi:hypothetical protein QDT05_03205 [Acinetobacter baumannii]|uniref:hypothetical protein n=1 Tax=Acinetobacter baumannii TaxID=470 RepID=UPI002449CA5D|nr:hypothetical protein [Acinetobacter baumannii]MDH2536531.1 hypothetical protein [Acinetobacter baumannii]MDH2601901.1 hypothetical protein [Acinetobacter baumannii]